MPDTLSDKLMTASILQTLTAALIPLLIPHPSTFTGPLLDSFVSVHDPLIEAGGECEKIYTVSTVLREVGVRLNGMHRTLSRAPMASTTEGLTSTDVSETLDDIRKARLRARLRAQSVSASPSTLLPITSKAELLKRSKERRMQFDQDIAKDEEEALQTFKKSLRDIVAMDSFINE